MNTLEQFLRYGELGPLRVGMGADELMDVLGPPDGKARGKNPRIVEYGALQVTITPSPDRSGDRVVTAGLYFQPQAKDVPEAIRPDDWLPEATATEADFRAYLNQIGYEPSSSFSDEGSRHLVLDSGATVTFTANRLHAIQYSHRGNSRSVALTLPDETFLRLRDLARSEGRSLSDLCAELLIERAANLQPG